MTDSEIVRWALYTGTGVVFSMIGLIWAMLNAKITRLEKDMQTLRDERHKNTESISEIKGLEILHGDDLERIQSKVFILSEKMEYLKRPSQ